MLLLKKKQSTMAPTVQTKVQTDMTEYWTYLTNSWLDNVIAKNMKILERPEVNEDYDSEAAVVVSLENRKNHYYNVISDAVYGANADMMGQMAASDEDISTAPTKNNTNYT